MKIERPNFRWRNFGRSIVVLLADFLIMIGLIGSIVSLLYFMFVCSAVEAPQLLSGKDYVDIIRSVAWPISLLIVLLLFRNPIMRIVYELPGFVRRSHYGQDVFSEKEKESAFRNDPKNKEEKYDRERDVDESFESNLRSSFKDDVDSLRTNNNEVKEHESSTIADKTKDEKNVRAIDYANIENVILKRLKKEYIVSDIKSDVRIRESNIVFDGAFWKDDHLYAIEIKFIRNPNRLQCYLERTAMFVQGLPKKYRENFSLILCLVSESELIGLSERAAAFIDKYAFEVILKHYLIAELNGGVK